MRSQSQIIVRRQVDDLLAIESADRRLLVVEHAKLEVRALGLEFVELIGEIRERIGAGCSGHDSLKLVCHGFARINPDRARLVYRSESGNHLANRAVVTSSLPFSNPC